MLVPIPADGTFPVDKGNRDAAASDVSMSAVTALLKDSQAVLQYHLSQIVFPEHLRFQKQKISASGSDLGGDLVFPKRIGFTGTPSDLLPQAMGACGFREGTEGEMVHTLTELRMMKPVVLRESLEHSGSLDWDSTMILTMIAKSHPAFEQPLHALIDTGALITGLSNQEVAIHLIASGLPRDGVVYLDENDVKMIYEKKGGEP